MLELFRGMDGLDLLTAFVGLYLICFAFDWVKQQNNTSDNVKRIMTTNRYHRRVRAGSWQR